MAVHTYEALFLLDPNKASADWEGAAHIVNGIITRHGGEILLTRPWGDMKLAYPIQKFRKGYYLLTYFTLDAQQLASINADFRITELILRKMIIKLHPRIATEILAHYTEEQHPEQQPQEAATA